MTDKTGGAAFPASGHPGKQHLSQEGMTLRDYFAAKAMQGDWASQSEDYNLARYTDDALDKQAKIYYRMADAMLRVREK
ncbi:hypothetical protein ACGABU_000720 [Morganella morganii]